jgi:hypothetical protein
MTTNDPTAQPAPIPPDDPHRALTVATPGDPALTHLSVVGDTYTIPPPPRDARTTACPVGGTSQTAWPPRRTRPAQQWPTGLQARSLAPVRVGALQAP